MTIEVTETNTDISQLGKRAVEYLRSSERDGAKAGGMAIYCLFQAWNVMTFEAIVYKAKSDEIEQSESFTLNEYCDPANVPFNANNTKNIKLMAARTRAIFQRVFGVTDPSAAEKQLLIRSLPVVQYLAKLGYEDTDVTLSKRNNLCVPFEAMHAEPDKAKASANEVKQYEAMIGESWEIDGKQGNSIAQLQRLAAPKKERSAQASEADNSKGASFVASAKLVTACVQGLMNENGDDDMPALSEDARKVLFDLATVLNGYFEVDPMEDQDEDKAAA